MTVIVGRDKATKSSLCGRFGHAMFATPLDTTLNQSRYQRQSAVHPSPSVAVSASDTKSAPSPYAALNGARTGASADAAPADVEAMRLVAETERLAALKRALWESFQVAPQSPVRAPIVDVTMAYTDALRLELRLRAAGRKPTTAPRVSPKTGFRSD